MASSAEDSSAPVPARQARWARWDSSVDQSAEQDFYSTSEAPEDQMGGDAAATISGMAAGDVGPMDASTSLSATPKAKNVDLPPESHQMVASPPPLPAAAATAEGNKAPLDDPTVVATALPEHSSSQTQSQPSKKGGALSEKRRSEGGRGILARLKRMSRVGTKEEKGGPQELQDVEASHLQDKESTGALSPLGLADDEARQDPTSHTQPGDNLQTPAVLASSSTPSPPSMHRSRESSAGSYGATGELFNQFASVGHGEGDLGSEASYSPEPEPDFAAGLAESGFPDGIAPLTAAYERGRGGSTTKLSQDVASLSLRDAGKEHRPRIVYGFSGAVPDEGPHTPEPSTSSAAYGGFRQRVGSFTPTIVTPGEEGRYPEEEASVYGQAASIGGSYFTYADTSHSRIRSVAPSLIGFDADDVAYDGEEVANGSSIDLHAVQDHPLLAAVAAAQNGSTGDSQSPSRASTPVQPATGIRHSRSESAGTSSGRATSGFATPVRSPTLSPSLEGPLTFPTRSARQSQDGTDTNIDTALDTRAVALSEGGSDDSAMDADELGSISEEPTIDRSEKQRQYADDIYYPRRPSTSMESRPVTSLAQNPEFISDAEAARHLSATPAWKMFRPHSRSDTMQVYADADGRPGNWLASNSYSPQERHYLVRELAQRQLQYEVARAWLFGHISLANRKAFDEDEYRIFRPDISDLNKPPPRLPLLRFLFDHVLSSFPLFATRGPERAKGFLHEALLPILRAKQQRSLSAAIDRRGEGDGTFFNARSTLDGLQRLLLKWTTRYITAVLRLDDQDGSSLKQPSPWPPADLIPPEAYMACRKTTTNALRHGGMEVSFVGMRVRQGSSPTIFACDYILAIRRPNRLVAYVVRNEADFKAYASNIARQLGPAARVKVLPPLGVYADSEDDLDDGEVVAPRLPGHPATIKASASQSSMSSSKRGTTRLRHFSSAKFTTDIAGVVNATRSVRQAGSGSSDGHSAGSANTAGATARVTIEDADGHRRSQDSTSSQNGGKSTPKKTPSGVPRFGLPNRSRSNLANTTGGPMKSHDSSDSLRALRHAPRAASTSSSLPTLPLLPNKRRRRLRAWLRDTLSVRGAGHASETLDFFDIGAFGDGDLRTADRISIAAVAQADGSRRSEAKRDELEAGADVLELRASFAELWKECRSDNGFLNMYAALRDSPSFSTLPIRYQQLLTWGNMQAARWLHGTFVASDTSRGNTARARELFGVVPWRKLEMAMREPTGLMIRRVQATLSEPRFLRSVLSVLLEDNETAVIQEQLEQLRLELPKTMYDKLAAFVEADDDLKRVVRAHAYKDDIPLVAAIVRSAEKPRLDREELTSIVSASKVYKTFMATQPSIVRQRGHKDAGFQLVVRLQRVLRLLSILRDGCEVRAAMQDLDTMRALAALFAPLGEALQSLHSAHGADAVRVLVNVRVFITRLLDTIAAQRARVTDPVDAINALTTLLDRSTPLLYGGIHQLAAGSASSGAAESNENGNGGIAGQGSGGLFGLFKWAQGLANIIETGSDDLADVWGAPPEAHPEAASNGTASKSSTAPSDDEAVVPLQTFATSLAAHARRKRNRQAELACRWAAGDTDAEMSIQVHGDGLGRSRIHPFFPREPRPTTRVVGTSFEEARRSFALAAAKVLGT